MSPSGQTSNLKLSLLGHVGHLTPEQGEALEEFRGLVATAGLYHPGDPHAGIPPSHDDATLLYALSLHITYGANLTYAGTVYRRFLRARGFVPSKALKQFTDAEAWRNRMDIENLYANFNAEEFVNAQNCYPMWIGRRDKMGYPIHVFRLISLDPARMAAVNAVPVERRYQRITVLHELLMEAVVPLCSMLPSESYPTPVDGTTTLVDLEGVSFGTMWSLRGHLQQASVLANANFPETMGMTYIVNAPSFFPTIWGWLKVWFDENTRRKIHILSKSMQHQLLDAIDAENLPKAYGGTLDWSFDDPPNLDTPAKEALKSIGGVYPKGPWAMIDGVPVVGKEILEKQRERRLPRPSAASEDVPPRGGEKH
ncbi:hypothetical protein FRB99_006895 [Tulasnella sp. 403]|nr:hypothetical protein FRB99_006895 [Tulasnella sp. 403]